MVLRSQSFMQHFSFTGLKRLRSYQVSWLRGDLLAGLTVAAYLIPQCMAYAELAGVQPIAGLWAILPPILIYALLGSSPQLSVGPESTTAVMTAAAIAPIAASSGSDYASLCSVLALLVGLICWIGAFARLGFLANLLSKPILIGYMAGIALLMIIGQLGKISGIPIEAGSLLGEVKQFLTQLNQIHLNLRDTPRFYKPGRDRSGSQRLPIQIYYFRHIINAAKK
ncbi:MAG TPA: hypothetical protein IGS53_05305 [Leptolyngbyaceae cyanobacterium M33_DOE_097]|uniref:SLC26A/SulP transporter domain-containing protein n=1 Tax=Oscillatoriales cyanobacterium SpSt-418 TaxID=2282169 RepID=A0A7C3KIH2_9CYAN|nr:hypothetical protein [Leptolyngbyaceae cyanobacterium M33_DOE_097]